MQVWRFEEPISAAERNYEWICAATACQHAVSHGRRRRDQFGVGHFLGPQNNAGIARRRSCNETFRCSPPIYLADAFARRRTTAHLCEARHAKTANAVRVWQI